MNYEPAPVPADEKRVPEFLSRELRRIANLLKTVAYQLGGPADASLSAGISADWKVAAGIYRLSTSSTITITGIADTAPNRQRTFVNVGTGVVVFKNEGTESSAPYRIALPANWNISAGATATLWYDAKSARHRGLSRT